MEQAYGSDHPRKVPAIAHSDDQGERHITAIAIGHLEGGDIRLLLGNRRSDSRQRSPLIADIHANFSGEFRLDIRPPLYIDPFLRLVAEFREILARLAMDNDTTSRRDIAQDGITGDRMTAFRECDYHPLRTHDCKGGSRRSLGFG